MQPRYTRPHPWSPLTDAEYAALVFLLPPTDGPGRPPENRRRTLDAIFWVACSKGPWEALPPELGSHDSAHRQLRRWAHAGVLDRLLAAAARARARRRSLLATSLRALEWRLCRAWRRMARLASVASLVRARRLGLWSALPCAPWYLPDPGLSGTIRRLVDALVIRARGDLRRVPPGLFGLCGTVLGFAGGARRQFRLA